MPFNQRNQGAQCHSFVSHVLLSLLVPSETSDLAQGHWLVFSHFLMMQVTTFRSIPVSFQKLRRHELCFLSLAV